MSKVDGNRRPKTGGRKKGTPNKITRDIREACQKHGQHCIDGLYKLSKHKQPAIRLGAIRELLDRGYGRSAQAGDITATGGITVVLNTLTGQLVERRTITIPKLNGSGNGAGYRDPAAE